MRRQRMGSSRIRKMQGRTRQKLRKEPHQGTRQRLRQEVHQGIRQKLHQEAQALSATQARAMIPMAMRFNTMRTAIPIIQIMLAIPTAMMQMEIFIISAMTQAAVIHTAAAGTTPMETAMGTIPMETAMAMIHTETAMVMIPMETAMVMIRMETPMVMEAIMDTKQNSSAGNELELYIHIPFCIKKCNYCDFLSGAYAKETQRLYFEALRAEIREASRLVADRRVSTVFWGGGTPSLAEAAEIEKTMALLWESFSFQKDAEITLEANPGTLSQEKLAAYRNVGINRLSIGCQSVHDEELQRLGRIHSFSQFLESFYMARDKGFDNINVDLMSGLPGQSLESWEKSLCTAAELGVEHISAYSLIVEEGTRFYQQDLDLPDEDTERRMYWRTGEILREYGFFQYEISNYAKPGFSCRHNEGYWRRRNYLGFGIGAASLLDEVRFSNERSLKKYLENSSHLQLIRQNQEKLGRREQIEETMILGLRMREGVREKEFSDTFQAKLEDFYGAVMERYIAQGFLEKKEGCLRLTARGIDVSNIILADFLLDSCERTG